MPKTTLRYAIIGFGGIAENRIAKEGFARDASRFEPLPGDRAHGRYRHLPRPPDRG